MANKSRVGSFLGQSAVGQNTWNGASTTLIPDPTSEKVGIVNITTTETTSPLTVKGDIEIFGNAATAFTSKTNFNLNIKAGSSTNSTSKILSLKGGENTTPNIPGSIVLLSGNQNLQNIPPYTVESTAQLEVGWNTIRIGTGSSLATLRSGGYLLGVSGKIIVEEVVVKLAANWPDFVFAKNYQLRSLFELESFIKANKRLPGIPSESELKEKDGIAVGDMLTRQMQKIEELTLYLIEQDKALHTLRAELEAIKTKGGIR